MIRVVYIGQENLNRINTINKIENTITNIIDSNNPEDIIELLPKDVIDLFVINSYNMSNDICKFIKTDRRLNHIPIILLIPSPQDIDYKSDIIVSDNVSEIEFLYQLKTMIKMKITDDELKKETIMLELKVEDRTKELFKIAERLRITFDSIGDGIIVTNEKGIIVSTNPVALNLCEYTKEDILSKNINDVLNIYKSGERINIFEMVSKNNEVILLTENIILKTKTGKELIISDSASPILNNNQKLIGIVVSFRDNTKEYEINKKLIDNEEKIKKTVSLLKATLESTADGILVIDNHKKVVQYNQKFKNMWKIPEEILSSEEDDKLLEFVMDQIKYPYEFISLTEKLYSEPDKTSLDIIELTDNRIFERYSIPQQINNQNVGRVWNFHDITDIKNFERDLIISKDKAEESNKLKTDFLANMSHEIKTPLNSILGFASLIDKYTPVPKLEDYLNTIISSGQLLLSIIDDIIDLSRMQSGSIKIFKEYFDIKELIIELSKVYIQQIIQRSKQINIVLDLDENNINEIYSDKNRIKQVLNNLVINAIKFTDSGTITCGYKVLNNNIIFFVEDTGIGISDDNLSKIFERFYRVKANRGKTMEGTGLGLTISKSIVNILGGDIWVKSEIDVGTIFYFSIPISDEEDELEIEEKKKEKNSDWSGKKILIIDDNEIDHKLMGFLFAQTKIKIDTLFNSNEIYSTIDESNYDIIIFNTKIQDINDINIIKYIKSHTKSHIITQSTTSSEKDKQKYISLGVESYVTKPIVWKILSNEINRLINL